MAVFGPGPKRGRMAAYSHTVAIPNAVVLTTTAATSASAFAAIIMRSRYWLMFMINAAARPPFNTPLTLMPPISCLLVEYKGSCSRNSASSSSTPAAAS